MPSSDLRGVLTAAAVVAVIPSISILGVAISGEDIWPHILDFRSVEATKNSALTTVWLGVTGLHGAIAAISPLLGYTLLTSAATPASRVAPAGAVIASSILWHRYLKWSLLLLVGSLLGLVLAPSVLGLVAAATAAWLVIVWTVSVFLDGFRLLEREDEFDTKAKQYLRSEILKAQERPKISDSLTERMDVVNNWLTSLPDIHKSGLNQQGRLYILGAAQICELLAISPSAVEQLSGYAEKHKLNLWRIGNLRVQENMAYARQALIALTSAVSAKNTEGQSSPPDKAEGELGQISEKEEHLQKILDEVIVFGRGDWSGQQARVPMLVTRHLSALLYRSLDERMPHDFKYGLDVLGFLIDEITAADKHGDAFELEVNRWAYDTPSYLVRKAAERGGYESQFGSELISYIRMRMRHWLVDDRRLAIAHSYANLASQLLVAAAIAGRGQVTAAAMYIREIPFLFEKNIPWNRTVVLRSLILAFLDERIASNDFLDSRRVILRTILEFVRFSRQESENKGQFEAEVKIVALACALYLSSEDERYEEHIGQILKFLEEEEVELGKVSVYFMLADNEDEIVARWKLDWWESGRKESGVAHIVSIHNWMLRAVAIVMSREAWRVKYVEDKDIPKLDVVGRLLRAVENPEGWSSKRDAEVVKLLTSLLSELRQLERRRQDMLDQKIAVSPLDLTRCKSYIDSIVSELRSSFGEHSLWLLNNNFAQVALDDVGNEAGIAQFVPREWFVSPDILDIGISVSTPSYGSELIRFEILKIAQALVSKAEKVTRIGSLDDERLQSQLKRISTSTEEGKFIIGAGLSRYELAALLDPSALLSARISQHFLSTTELEPGSKYIVIGQIGSSFTVKRGILVPNVEATIYKDQLDAALGAVEVGMFAVSQEDRKRWASEQSVKTEPEVDSAGKLVFRIRWRFQVNALDTNTYTVFRIQNEEPGP